jgi:fructose-1,6-bisphosphatase/inositol monophosphatase family enzyme
LVYTARGIAAGAFIPQAYLWDLVAGVAILNRAGGEVRYLSGKMVDYQVLLDGRLTPEPIIACHPNLQAELRAAIRSRQSSY